jgi:predicted RNA-binding protein with PIN domain
MSRFVVDGMNVIGSRPTGWWRDRPGAMRGLVEELGAFAAREGHDVTVVFDGRSFDLEGDGVEVMFASRRGPNAADDDIAALVERDAAPGELSVVTSDGDLARRVRVAGAVVVGAGEFRRRLDG